MSDTQQDAKQKEWQIVGLMALGFGLVGIDRFLITPLFPIIAKDLNLSYSDIGIIAAALAGGWSVSALLMGNLSDYIGRRKVLVGALILFSLLIGTSGLAASLTALVLVRVAMGVADGAYVTPSISATIEASPAKRHGLNIGIQQMMLPLCGLALAPWLVELLLPHMSWRYIFVLFAVPGLLLAFLVWRYLPDAAPATGGKKSNLLADLREIVRHRNMRLLMVLMLCWLTCLMITAALMPSYLTDFLKLDQKTMVGVMAAVGIGSTVGTLALPVLSDLVGRKPVVAGSIICTAASLWMLMNTGAHPGTLFFWLAAVHCFNNACITLVAPITAETVSPRLMATGAGAVVACGEIGGGFVAPYMAGRVADACGIQHILWLPLAAICLAFILSLFLKETRWSPSHGE